ncbi:MAG: SDR family NAD(P)-dependent oxidoreductase [Spirochaetales bacterium]
MPRDTALITGASDGIGRELARVMARDKWNLVLVARREDRLEELQRELSTVVSVATVPFDLSREDAARRIVEHLSDRDITIEALINNAGLGDHCRFVDSDWETNRAMMRVNIEALTELTRLLLPSMISRGGGFVMNVSSVAGFQPGPMMAVYYATKAYVLSFSEALAEEVRGSGVSVTALCPGPTRSGFQESAGIAAGTSLNNRLMPTARKVAQYGYDAMMRGRRVAVYGLVFRVLILLNRFLPRRLVVWSVARFQANRTN